MFVKFFFVMDLMKLGKIKEHQSQSCSSSLTFLPSAVQKLKVMNFFLEYTNVKLSY